MKIKEIKFKKFNLGLKHPFSYFTASLDSLPYILVKVKTDTGLTGIGEASLAWDITGETPEGATGLLKYIELILTGKEIGCLKEIEKMLEEINDSVYGNSALKAAIEISLLDVLSQDKNMPIYQLFGAANCAFVIPQKVFSYSEKHSDDLLSEVEKALELGYSIFKFKAGDDTKGDISLIRSLVSKFPDIKIVFDVNQGWFNASTAIKKITELEKFKKNILWIEQPINHDDYDGLAKICAVTDISIMADESCHNLFDLENLYFRKSIDMINIKLAKTGGIFEALKMIKFCETKKIGYMLGDMISSQAGTAANLHLAALGNFVSFDLTSPKRFKSDPTEGLIIKDAKFFIPAVPGLGAKEKN